MKKYKNWLKSQRKLNMIEKSLKQGQRVKPSEFRRHLKHNITNAEQLLWSNLMNDPRGKGRHGTIIGFAFQKRIGPYFADFCCRRAKLVVELDGAYHDRQKEYDNKRDAFMTGRGFLVLRFNNEDVFADIQAVLSKIYSTALELAK